MNPIKVWIFHKGKYGRVEANPEQPSYLRIFFDRAAGQRGAHEEFELRPLENGGGYSLVAVAANRLVSISPTGSIETRHIDALGPWEEFEAFLEPSPSEEARAYVQHGKDIPVTLTIEERS